MKDEKFNLSPVYCLHNGAVVLEQKDRKVVIGLTNPEDEQLRERLSNAVVQVMKTDTAAFVPLSHSEFTRKISTLFSASEKKSADVKNTDTGFFEKEETNIAAALLESLIEDACEDKVTDIHIEESVVRFRKSGILEDRLTVEGKTSRLLVQRIKLLAKLNVVEKRHGQDGQFVYRTNNSRNVFIRVSCMPVISTAGKENAESVVLRVLDTERIPLEIKDLGFGMRNQLLMEKFCRLKDGLVLICGPTGSGKSTTAAAILTRINREQKHSKKILTLEDPPEYLLDGISQIQIHAQNNMDFPEVLRRSLRQDPDVLFIGEIRDEVTARISVQASLTGHLVFATLHVGKINQALLRMCDFGIEKNILLTVMRGIILQHLEQGKMNSEIKSYLEEED